MFFPDDDDVKVTGAVILLGCLYKISPAASRKGGTGSRPEVLKSLLTFVPSENDITGAIQEHALATPGPFEPIIIAVGEPYNSIASVFFCLTESTLWKFKSFPEALDAGFKIIHAVASPYPASCYTTWLAIQLAFYHIKTKYDDYSRSLKQLLLDLGLASTLQPYLALK